MWIFIVVFAALGILQLISPRAGWWIANFWRFEPGAEPSAFALTMYRIQGAIYSIVAVVIFMMIRN